MLTYVNVDACQYYRYPAYTCQDWSPPLSDDLLDLVESKVVASRYELETRVLHAGRCPLKRHEAEINKARLANAEKGKMLYEGAG